MESFFLVAEEWSPYLDLTVFEEDLEDKKK